MIHTLDFIHNGILLNAEIEYSVESREGLDVLEVIGEITDNLENVYDSESKEMKRALRSAFVSKYQDEIDEEREIRVSEMKGFNRVRVR